MTRLIFPFVLILLLLSGHQVSGKQGRTTAREILVTMETTLSGFPDPNTPFLESGGRDKDICYPQPFRNHIIREKPVDIKWRIVVLENDLIRVEFAPELGGMIWRLYDKVHNTDVLHAPQKVKPVADGFGGTYTPGGIEFNYPYAHSISNTWPRKTDFRENRDGSATYIVTEWERNGRTEWALEFTLRPGEGRINQKVTLYNRSRLPAGFVYWGNSRVPANGDTKWIEPEAMSSEHGGSNIFTWPVFRGVDLSLMINDPEVIGMYFLEPHYNFFGLTNLRTGSGMIHYADRHDLPGKKLWNWGRTPMDGNRKWDPAGRSGSEPHFYGYEYGEVQSGRMVNQDHLEWLLPEECIIWDEAWSPIYGLTDVSEVTEDAAFQLKPGENKLMIYPFKQAEDVKLVFRRKGEEIKVMRMDAVPGQLKEIDLGNISADIRDLEIDIVKAGVLSGNVSLTSRCRQKKATELRETPVFSEHSSESLTNWAEFDHKLLYRKRAMENYKAAIELDSLNYRAHLGLGKLLFAIAEFSEAEQQFKKAIESYKWAGEAYLMLAQIQHITGDVEKAAENAYLARYYGEKCRGNLKLGEILISEGEFQPASAVLEEALVNNGRSFRTYPLLALCERKGGDTGNAAAWLKRTPAGALRDLMWYSEAWFSGIIDEKALKNELFNDEWRFLELGLDYLQIGMLDEAGKIADEGISLHKSGWQTDKLLNPERLWNFKRKRENPLFYLLKGEIAKRRGISEEAEKFFLQGDYYEHYINFNQEELVPVLQDAVAAGNGYAGFWLGNFYFHNMRPMEAKAEWDVADAKHPGTPQIMRNMAVYDMHIGNDPLKSRDLLRQALALNKKDLFLRRELIAAEKVTGTSSEEILRIYLDAPAEQRDSYLFQHGLLNAFTDAGKWEEAAEYLKTVNRQWSDDVSSWYYFCVGFADFLLDKNNPEESLEWIRKCSDVPSNLSNVSLPPDYFYRQREFYIEGLAWKKIGNIDKSREFFNKVINEQTDFLFNESAERRIQQLRFYTALAMAELGMENSAVALLSSINEYRLKRGLIFLGLSKAELKKWDEMDPLAEPAMDSHAH